MTSVRLTGSYQFPLARNTPGGRGFWNDVFFTLDKSEEVDYLVSFNYPTIAEDVFCPPERCWAIVQEPSTPHHCSLHTSHSNFARLYSNDRYLKGKHRVLSFPALTWSVNRTYDWLTNSAPPEKSRALSTVTSNLSWLPGHKRRLQFLKRVGSTLDLDWFGRGFSPLDDKWDGIAPYRYSIAIENTRSPHYWTEKLLDCFTSWTMPIYCGSPNITEYFPAESMLLIDIDRPDEAVQQIREAIDSKLYERSLDAIRHSRDLVLNKYNTLNFIAEEVAKNELSSPHAIPKYQVIHPRIPPSSVIQTRGYVVKYCLEWMLRSPAWFC